MPNSRRRKFLVNQNLKNKHIPSLATKVESSTSNKNVNAISSKSNIMIRTDSRDTILTNTSVIKHSHENKLFSKASKAILATAKHAVITSEKEATANFSLQDLRKLMESTRPLTPLCDKCSSTNEDSTRSSPQTSKQKPLARRERHVRQHKIKIRRTKPKSLILDNQTVVENSIKVNTGKTIVLLETPPIECVANAYLNIDRISSESLGSMCRICHGVDTLSQELGNLISACSCRGTVGRVHVRCLERWLTESGKSRCELCGIKYTTRRVHRYGVPRALVMWILSQNAKQSTPGEIPHYFQSLCQAINTHYYVTVGRLMVDSLGIMLMTPLAVLAAWLSGRTLSTLISQQNHDAPGPWPLASTFVLACMTLVCYYCWIVSAATRHALSWWIWYRSQYEVRLQITNDGED